MKYQEYRLVIHIPLGIVRVNEQINGVIQYNSELCENEFVVNAPCFIQFFGYFILLFYLLLLPTKELIMVLKYSILKLWFGIGVVVQCYSLLLGKTTAFCHHTGMSPHCNRDVTLETPSLASLRSAYPLPSNRHQQSVIQWKNCHVENNIINRASHSARTPSSPQSQLIGCTFVE